MKQFVILFTVLIAAKIPLTGKAQCLVQISQLEQLCAYSASSFETYALNSGFSLYRNVPMSSVENGMVLLYWCDKKRANGGVDQLSKTFATGRKGDIGFTTTDKNYYLNFKKALTVRGYRLTETETNEVVGQQTIWYYYANSRYISHIYSYDVDGVTRYSCNIRIK